MKKQIRGAIYVAPFFYANKKNTGTWEGYCTIGVRCGGLPARKN